VSILSSNIANSGVSVEMASLVLNAFQACFIAWITTRQETCLRETRATRRDLDHIKP